MATSTFQLPPFFIEIDGIQCQILEVTKTRLISGDEWFHVTVSIHYKGIRSKTFTIDCKNEKDMANKLKVEITKIKFTDYAYGLEEVKKLIS